MAGIYPQVAFRFSVQILEPVGSAPSRGGADGSFTEVTGIELKVDTEDVAEGGEPRFVHRLPKTGRYSNLVLKRGVIATDSVLARWVEASIGSAWTRPVVTKQVLVKLLNEVGAPLIVWRFENAYPVRWQVSEMNSMSSKILTETLELCYTYFERAGS